MSLITINELLKGVEQLETNKLEEFIQKTLQIRAKRVAPSFSKEEASLMKKINNGLSREKRQRKAILWGKRENETLTQSEYDELMILIDEYEKINVERVINIGKLAQLKKVPALQLMEDLGIKPNHNG